MDNSKLIEEYMEFRRKKDVHENTIDLEVKYINKFNSSVLAGINEDAADNPFSRITRKHVEEFFHKECEVLAQRTVYRKITIITHFFDFLFQRGLVMIDFMPKFRSKFKKLEWEKPELHIDYLDLLDKKQEILGHGTINLMPRTMFLLLIYGLELKDIMNITIDDLKVEENNQEIYLFIYNQNTSTDRIIHIHQEFEYSVLKDAFDVALIRETKYLVHSKSGNAYSMYNPSNLHDMMKPINEIIGYSIASSKQTMYAYVYYLVREKNYSIEEVARILGKPLTVTANLVKTVLERVE